MPGFTLAHVRTAVRGLIRDTGTTRVFPLDEDFDEPYIRQALNEYSERRPRRVPFYKLEIQAGVGAYNLPVDWLRRDEDSWQKAFGTPAGRYQYVPYPAGSLAVNQAAPYPPSWLAVGAEARFLDDQQQLLIYPEPVTAATLVFDYLAVHVVDPADATLTTVGMLDRAIIERIAAANVLDAIAVEKELLLKYKLARGLEIDNTRVPEELKSSAAGYRQAALVQFGRPVMMRG